jgi:SNF2 family DNA or RNA helicase
MFGYEVIEKDDAYHTAGAHVFFGVNMTEQGERATLLYQDAGDLLVPGLRVDLYPFQTRAVRFFQRTGRGILGDEPGLGKTVQALAWALLMEGRTVVVCPAGACGVWEAETKGKTDLSVAVMRGASAQQIQATDVVVIPYSVLHHHLATLRGVGFANLIVDEAHYIKNPESERSRAVKELSVGIQRRLLMSGTLLLRGNEDVWAVARLVHPMMPTWDAFKERYCKIQEVYVRHLHRKVRQVAGPKNSEELRTRLHPWIATRRLSEVRPDLPELREQQVEAPLEGKHRSGYVASIHKLRDNVGDDRKAREAFDEALEALQGAKTAAALELLEELWPNEDRKALAFSQRLAPLDELESVKTWQDSFIRLDGSVKPEERTRRVARFQSEPRIRLALCQLEAAGTALTMDKADTVLIVDPGWVPANVDQAIRRARRVNTKHPVIAYHFIVKGTLDERRWKRMDDRRKALQAMHGADQALSTDDDTELCEGLFEDALVEAKHGKD